MTLLLLRYLWAAPNTMLGLVLAMLAWPRGGVAAVAGVIEVHGPLLRWLLADWTFLSGGVDALTLGHVVIGRDAQVLVHTRAHERVHVRQYERWGPLFLPAYVAASVWSVARGRHFYWNNAFEREAWALDDGGGGSGLNQAFDGRPDGMRSR